MMDGGMDGRTDRWMDAEKGMQECQCSLKKIGSPDLCVDGPQGPCVGVSHSQMDQCSMVHLKNPSLSESQKQGVERWKPGDGEGLVSWGQFQFRKMSKF